MPAKAASSADIKLVEKLFQLAVHGSASLTTGRALTEAKLFEIYTLARLLNLYRKANPTHRIRPSMPPPYRFAWSPCNAQRSLFTYFIIENGKKRVAEAWISLQAMTLSYSMAGAGNATSLSAKHEIDVGFFAPFNGANPLHSDVLLAASCKHVTSFHKEMVREALGIRRETALLADLGTSKAPWFIAEVPASPPSVVALISSDTACRRYRKPIDELGVYPAYLRFPR